MSDELKPCPFCGSDKVLVIGMADKPLDCYRWHVECQECHCTGRHFHRDEGARREMAVAAWNRRVPGVGVPAEAIQQCMEDLITYQMGNPFMVDPETIAIATVRAWLDAQPTQGQE